MSKNLVLGLLKGYNFEQIRPFLVSLKQTGYTGEVCFIYSDLAPETLKSLQDFGVKLVPFREKTFRIFNKKFRFYFTLNRIYRIPLLRKLPLNRWYAHLVNLVSWRGGINYEIKSRIATSSLNIYCNRFAHYYLFLSRHKGVYENVMLTDVRDVIFQRDPFEFEIGDNVCCFLEDSRVQIKDCAYNSEWMRDGFGKNALDKLGKQVISCSGVTIGSASAITEYLKAMVDHILLLKYPTGMDQAVHNFVLYNGLVPKSKIFPNDAGPVETMNGTKDLPVKFSAEGLVVDSREIPYNVLHQYDRHITAGKLKLEEKDGLLKLIPTS